MLLIEPPCCPKTTTSAFIAEHLSASSRMFCNKSFTLIQDVVGGAAGTKGLSHPGTEALEAAPPPRCRPLVVAGRPLHRGGFLGGRGHWSTFGTKHINA